MRGLELHDADSRGFLVVDLRDVLACLGSDALKRMWTCYDVESYGEGADDFFDVVYRGRAIPGAELIDLSRRVVQIIKGAFYGSRPGEEMPSIVIRVVDSSFWEVFGSEECLRKIESGFLNVRPASEDAG